MLFAVTVVVITVAEVEFAIEEPAPFEGPDGVDDESWLLYPWYKILFTVAVPAKPKAMVCPVDPALLLKLKTISNSYTVLLDKVTPTLNKVCALVPFVPT